MAPKDIWVGLSSSDTSVGIVSEGLAIDMGETFAAAWFRSTLVPGSTIIKAAAAGLVGGSATMTTVAPGAKPIRKLRVWLAPSKLPADGDNVYDSVVVSLEDEDGKPVEATSSISVALSSSNTSV